MFGRASENDVGDLDLVAWVKDLPLSRIMGKPAIDLGSEFDDGVALAELFADMPMIALIVSVKQTYSFGRPTPRGASLDCSHRICVK